jgi:hypothetical protein
LIARPPPLNRNSKVGISNASQKAINAFTYLKEKEFLNKETKSCRLFPFLHPWRKISILLW